MHLNFRNLLWTELKDSKTGAFLDTGNGALYYDICLPDDVDINIFLKDVHDLKIDNEETYTSEEDDEV